MNSCSFARFNRWLSLPTGVLMALLQRSPAVKVVAAVGEYIVASPVGAVLKGVITAAASLGAVNSLAGATTLETSPTAPSPLAATVGTLVNIRFGITGAPSDVESWSISGTVPAGLAFYTTSSGTTGGITTGNLNGVFIYLRGTPTAAGSASMTIQAVNTVPAPTRRIDFPYTVNVTGAVVAVPTITAQPASVSVAAGGTATFSVTATGTALTYQWQKDNVNIAGQTTATLSLPGVQASSAGSYTVVVANGGGSVTSSAATLTVTAGEPPLPPPPPPSGPGRIINLSARATAGAGDRTLIVGMAISAGTTKSLLIRAIGPTLTPLGVPGALADPALTLFTSPAGANIGSNDNWATDAQVTPALLSRLGAFAFASPTSRDAGMVGNLAGGNYTAHITSTSGTGVALAEFYDASQSFNAGDPRLVNISARAQVGVGADVLIAGFIIGGTTPVRVLIRAVGPELAAFGVNGVLANPRIIIRTPDQVVVQENDNWGTAINAAEIQAAFATAGAFSIPNTSLSSAALLTLQPGAYTAVVDGVGDTTGVAIVEVYELP